MAANGTSNGAGASTLDSKWRRASLPIADMYSDINGLRARSGSAKSNSSNAIRRSQYHETTHHGAITKDKILRDSPVIAELRTNVIVRRTPGRAV